MDIVEPTQKGVQAAVDMLSQGDVVGIPTETVYGLAANAWDDDAVAAVFDAKHRPEFDPLIVHLPAAAGAAALDDWVDWVALGTEGSERVRGLVDAFWPGPLTLVLPKLERVSELVTSGLPRVALRMPDHQVAQQVLKAFDGPLVAPSANRFGSISPTSASDVVAELSGRVRMVIDGGPCLHGIESTVLAVESDGAGRLLRPGAIPREVLEPYVRALRGRDESSATVESPGQIYRHYAPRTPVRLLPTVAVRIDDEELRSCAGPQPVSVLRVAGEPAELAERLKKMGVEVVEARTLSPTGDLVEAATVLFRVLRAMDQRGVAGIVVEPPVRDDGLGHAIRDRLVRASRPEHT